MGQYHIPVNLDKREYIHPHKLGDGLKLLEQAFSANGTAGALVLLLAASNGDDGRGGGDFYSPDFTDVIGRWAGDRIALVGDYAEADDLDPEHRAEMIYDLCRSQEGVNRQIEWMEKNLRESIEAGRDTVWGKPISQHQANIDFLRTTIPFTDISERVAAAMGFEG